MLILQHDLSLHDTVTHSDIGNIGWDKNTDIENNVCLQDDTRMKYIDQYSTPNGMYQCTSDVSSIGVEVPPLPEGLPCLFQTTLTMEQTPQGEQGGWVRLQQERPEGEEGAEVPTWEGSEFKWKFDPSDHPLNKAQVARTWPNGWAQRPPLI